MEELKPFRDKIDALDVELVDLLAQRFGIVREVGALKARENIDIVQSARVEEVLDHVEALAKAKGIDGDLIRNMWALMIDRAHVIENEIKDERQAVDG